MNWYKRAKYYSVNRDDSEMRLIVCPKCRKADIKKTDKTIPLSNDGYVLKLCECNKCHTWFTFYREDGMRDVTKEEAKEAIKNGHIDLQDDGKDSHGHCYYVMFTDKPKTISEEEYDKNVFDADYEEGKRWKEKNLIDIGLIARNADLISKIIFNGLE